MPEAVFHYHVQRHAVTRFRTGKSYSFSEQQNFFARDLFGIDPLVPVGGTEGMSIDFLLKDYFDPAGFNHYRHLKSKATSPDEKGLLRTSLLVLNHQAMVLREPYGRGRASPCTIGVFAYGEITVSDWRM
jgi:hypothetical protein